jgi:hypothetical protein
MMPDNRRTTYSISVNGARLNYYNYTPTIISCQEESNNPNDIKEISMKNFVSFKVNDLFKLLDFGSGTGSPTILHKDKEKKITRMVLLPDGNFNITIKNVQSRAYVFKPDDEIKLNVDAEGKRFRCDRWWNAFGSTRKFRCRDWNLGHYGVFISEHEVFDSVRGRRNVDDLPYRICYFDEESQARRKNEIAELKSNFLADPAANMTCGFELETQATKNTNRRHVHKRGKLIYARSVMDQVGPAFMLRWMRINVPYASSDWKKAAAETTEREWKQWLSDNKIHSYEDAINAGHIPRTSLEDITGWMADILESDSFDDETALEFIVDDWNLGNNVEVATDESVQGFEFRTKGAQTVEEFESSLERVFDLDHAIDTRCSFHIHIQVKGIKHSFNRAQRQHLIQYLFKNVDRLPASIKQRWADHNANYFFLPDEGDAKMNFINFHSKFRTLEFRCFGNITNKEDGLRCLEIAVEALQDFYANETSIFIDGDAWSNQARSPMEEGTLDEFIKAHEKHINIAKENQLIMERILPELHQITRGPTFRVGA